MTRFLPLVALALLAGVCVHPRPAHAADEVRFDFESGDLDGWKVLEGGFASLISEREVFHNALAERYNKQGRYFLSTLEKPDGSADDTQVGVVQSPTFTLTGPKMSFLIGGGNHPDTYVALCTEDGKEALRASGDNAEKMRLVEWNAPDLVGKRVFLRAVDRNTGSWGHVTLDDFRATGQCEPLPAPPPDRIRWGFETGDLQGFKVVAGKFGRLVDDRIMCRNDPKTPDNHQGRYFMDTCATATGGFDDGFAGVIESPAFTLKAARLSLLVGGGGSADTYVALCTEDGTEVAQARGASAEPLNRVTWEMPQFVGQTVFVQIVDRNTGGWGHITFDDFRATGTVDLAASERVWAQFAERDKARAEREKALAAKKAASAIQHKQDLLSDAYLFARGEQRVYRDENLTGISMPLGGIGTGDIQISGTGDRRIWQIFNNHSQAFVPDSIFAVRAVAQGGKAVLRALQTTPAGPFAGMKALTFRGEYPFGWYDFEDGELPVQVRMEAFSPFVPLDVKASGMPCNVYNLTASNKGDRAVTVSFLATQQNAVGYRGEGVISERAHPAYGGNTNETVREGGATVVRMAATGDPAGPGFGDMALGVLDANASASADWSDAAKLAEGFGAGGKLAGPEKAGPSPTGHTLDGALAVTFTLKPGETKTVPFFLAWHFPNGAHGEGVWGGKGNQYANWWPNALEVACDLSAHLGDLTRQTRLYHDSVYASNLPRWLLDRATSQLAILRSQTCFWTKEGYFGGWEGCGSGGGCCMGNCDHVWHYAQGHARLFPQIGRLMREQELAHQVESGAIPHRQAPGVAPAFDGQCGAILGAYREHLTSANGQWLHTAWPKLKKAMDHVIRQWDRDEDGVLAGAQWNTLDENVGGSTSWMGSLYCASLAACERMATLEGEANTAARYRRIREAGAKAQDETLFNGEYYIQIPDNQPRRDYVTGCHVDQALGQWWANQLDLGVIYPTDRVRTAMKSLVKYNFHPSFQGIAQAPRKFVDDYDAGLQMITWPKGGRPDGDHCMLYGDEVMTGFEYAAAATMIQSGLLKEGLMVARATADRYDGGLRAGLSGGDYASWGFSGNPFGDDECGKFYARAMSSWSLLLACQGFIYDGPAGRIGFVPVWKPEDHVSFFTAAEGYGVFTQRREKGEQTERIEVRSGKLDVAELVFAVADNKRPAKVTVTVAGAPVVARAQVREGRVTLTLPARMTVKAGEAIVVVMR